MNLVCVLGDYVTIPNDKNVSFSSYPIFRQSSEFTLSASCLKLCQREKMKA